ncbi:4Fe-4S binding protein [bacterium AH-315-J21]|nr:4Fe-4S binding protein [bacterium AH-315-J21]
MQTGLLNTYQKSVSNRSYIAWVMSGALLTFYVLIYFTDFFTPIAAKLHLGGKWGMYGTLYTIFIVVFGIVFLRRHGQTPYQRLRTLSIMFFQVVFAFALPHVMEMFDTPGYNFAYFWPLNYSAFFPSTIVNQPLPFILYSMIGAFILVPVLTFFYGKRWYCSWVCGCGGLAETAGDSFRHLSSKSTKAWRFERYSIHIVLLFAVVTTVIVVTSFIFESRTGDEFSVVYPIFSKIAGPVKGLYGFLVGAILSGVLGVGLYPLMGSRVWCRFFCPLAAFMGLIQKFGRFRITVKDDMCISCGNCSTYCEMGIDVRQYAQNNQDFKRAACVGCGLCAHVCPRGVLKLENKWDFASWGDAAGVEHVDV